MKTIPSIQPGQTIESPQVVRGQVKEAIVKEINSKRTGEAFNILEFTFTNIQNEPLKERFGSLEPKVGLACDGVNRQTVLGQLANVLFEWEDENPLDTDLFIGAEMDFLMEFDGEYWVIDRRSLGPKGHLDDRKK